MFLVSGFYKILKLYYNCDIGEGCLFFYFVYGVLLLEVLIDIFIGEYIVDCVDIFYDVGDSFNFVIDKG